MGRINPRKDPVRAPSQKRSQERVKQILEAAKTVIEEKGAAGMKMGDIANKAGITMGSIYQYFPNKGAIVAELAASYLSENTDKNEEILATRPESLVELSHITTRLLNQYYELSRQDPVTKDIWLGLTSDKELQTVDANDTIRNRDAIFEASRHLFREECHDTANRALLMIITLGGAAVNTAAQFSELEGRRVLDDAIKMLHAAWSATVLPLGREL